MFTVFTSIGYGTFAPITAAGQLFTIACCLFGIGVYVFCMSRFCTVYTLFFNRSTKWLSSKMARKWQSSKALGADDLKPAFSDSVTCAIIESGINILAASTFVVAFSWVFYVLGKVRLYITARMRCAHQSRTLNRTLIDTSARALLHVHVHVHYAYRPTIRAYTMTRTWTCEQCTSPAGRREAIHHWYLCE